MIFLSVEDVIQLHDELVSENGGLHGIRDLGLLISALEMPKSTMFGEDLHYSIYDKAAAYLFHIICNHAFLGGNKRTGTACALIFLKQNGITIKCDHNELVHLICNVAQGLIDKDEISDFFEKNHR